MTMLSTAVIPAQAGIQTGLADVREGGLDSRLRGNDVVGGEILQLLVAIEDDIAGLRSDMLDFRVELEATRQEVAAVSRNAVRLAAEMAGVNKSIDRIERRLDLVEVVAK